MPGGDGGSARGSATGVSPVRPGARSRSRRDVDENIKLRRCLGGASGGASWRDRSRAAASSTHGADGVADDGKDGGSPVGSPSARPACDAATSVSAPGGRGTATCCGARRFASGAGLDPSWRAMSFSSLTATHRLRMINPEQVATEPARINVLPSPNSLMGIPKPIARRPARRQPIPATNIPIVIKITPGPRSRQRRKPLQPPRPRYRHIAHPANRQLLK